MITYNKIETAVTVVKENKFKFSNDFIFRSYDSKKFTIYVISCYYVNIVIILLLN